MAPRIVGRDAWLAERLELLAAERAATHALDAVRAKRRLLPWVEVTTPYRFATATGEVALADLFDGRSQLAIYHFMLPPEGDDICPGCAFLADHADAARQHFEQADLSFAAVSRAAPARIESVKRRFGWRFAWVSSGGTSFNADFGVSFTPEEIAAGHPLYNYGTTPGLARDLHGISIFARKDRRVFHTYSAYSRGGELLIGAFNWLDLTPKGREEADGIMNWVRLHDEYGTPQLATCCAA